MNKLYAVYIYSFKFWVEKKDCRNYTKMRISMIVEVFSFSIVPKLSLICLCYFSIKSITKIALSFLKNIHLLIYLAVLAHRITSCGTWDL